MIARSALPFTLRSIIDRVGPAPAMQRGGRGRRWQRMIAALEDWWTTSYLRLAQRNSVGRPIRAVPPILPRLR